MNSEILEQTISAKSGAALEPSYPTPEEIKNRLDFRVATTQEKERLTDLPEAKRLALKNCAEIFNANCEYPWYVIGSIAFILNADKTTKQPDDIDIIFHIQDFPTIAKKFISRYGFTSGVDQTTGCPYLRGILKVETRDENNRPIIKEVNIEAFAQDTENPNGLINPGVQNKKYGVIINDLNGVKFNTPDREGQIELYVKNLLLEFRNYSPEKIGEKNRGFNRLANLYELLQGDTAKLLNYIKQSGGGDLETINFFVNIFCHFKNKKGPGLSRTYEQGDMQKVALELDQTAKQILTNIEKTKNKLAESKTELIQRYARSLKSFFLPYENAINGEDSRDFLPYIALEKIKSEFCKAMVTLIENAPQNKKN